MPDPVTPPPAVQASIGRQDPTEWAKDLMGLHQAKLILTGKYRPDENAMTMMAERFLSMRTRLLAEIKLVDRVLELHRPIGGTRFPDCAECGDGRDWPCDTARIAEGAPDA